MERFIDMRQLLNILLIALLVVSCNRDGDIVPEQRTGEVDFLVESDGEQESGTRAAITAGMIDNLYVLVFDGSGRFISRHRATLSSGVSTYKVTLPISASPRILHFVANYTWSNFSDVASLAKNETEIIPSLSVGSGTIAYWQRLERPTGIAAGALSSTISLLRNVLRVSTVNLTTGNFRLANVTFGMGDVLDKGIVSPFNTASATPFVQGDAAVAESPTAVFNILTEAQFATAGTTTVATGTPINAYERKNATSTRPAFVIVKGYYQTPTNPTNVTVASYYKIDIVDPAAETLLNLRRNIHYVLRLNSVANGGYPTLAEAMHAPASNNISSSILIQEFTSVSDGTSQLNVETVSRLFVKAGQAFSIKYSYIPNSSTGVVNNTSVTVQLVQDALRPVVSGTLTNTTSTGTISGTTAALPGITDVNTATIVVTAGGLQRKINLRLRPPYDFTNRSISPASVANATDQPVELRFTIPNTMNESEFPMPIYISSRKLSPNLQGNTSDLEVDVQGGQYRYIYIAEGIGEQVVSFVTNSTNSTETITISGDYFRDATYALNTVLRQPLTNLNFTPNGDALAAQKNQTVNMTFTIPIVVGVLPPFAINIHTNDLTFQSAASGTVVATNFGYTYTTNNTGNHTVVFRTNKADNEEYVRIDESRYASIGFMRLCKKMDFVNPRFTAVSGVTGNPISMWFALPSAYDFALNDNKCEVYIYTTQLEPATGNPSNLVAVTHPQYGVGYKYTTSVRADQEVKFKTLTNYSYETVKLVAAGFNTSSILRNFSFSAASIAPLPRNTNSTNTTMTMTIGVPQGSVPAGGLVVRIESQDLLVAFPTTQAGLVRVGSSTDTSGYFEYTVTAAGTYTLTFRNRVTTSSVRQQSILLSSPAFVTSTNLNQ